jgi:hypothetical protein
MTNFQQILNCFQNATRRARFTATYPADGDRPEVELELAV